MAKKEQLLAEFKKLGVNPPGGANVAELELTLWETKRNMGKLSAEELDNQPGLVVEAPESGAEASAETTEG